MRKSIAKLMATVGALSMLASAIPFAGVSAAETDEFTYDVVDGGVVITEWKDATAEEVTIPATVEDQAVIGVADYAFAYCSDLAVINVPDSLKLDNMANNSFLTSSMVIDFLDSELSDTATTDDIIRYVAEKADYKGTGENGAITDSDIANLSVKLANHLNKVDISVADTVEGKIMTLFKNINNMGFSQTNVDKFNVYVTGIPYGDLTLKGKSGTEIETYANGKKINFVANDFILGDANGDGKLKAADASFVAALIASASLKGEKVSVEDYPAADMNQDGKISAADAAAIAKKVAESAFAPK